MSLLFILFHFYLFPSFTGVKTTQEIPSFPFCSSLKEEKRRKQKRGQQRGKKKGITGPFFNLFLLPFSTNEERRTEKTNKDKKIKSRENLREAGMKRGTKRDKKGK
jgi:hypothetical protein